MLLEYRVRFPPTTIERRVCSRCLFIQYKLVWNTVDNSTSHLSKSTGESVSPSMENLKVSETSVGQRTLVEAHVAADGGVTPLVDIL